MSLFQQTNEVQVKSYRRGHNTKRAADGEQHSALNTVSITKYELSGRLHVIMLNITLASSPVRVCTQRLN